MKTAVIESLLQQNIWNFIKKVTPAQVFSYELDKVLKAHLSQ